MTHVSIQHSENILPTDTQLDELASKLIKLALSQGIHFACAESLTAGMISSTIANISGASQVFLGGVVSYDARVKQSVLHVSQKTIDEKSVVSPECAQQMAQGVMQLLKADAALSVTGVAGPKTMYDDAPVGTVYISVVYEESLQTFQYCFSGNRQQIRKKTSYYALKNMYELIKSSL